MAGKEAINLPQLSNEAQLKIMDLVKKGMPMEKALKRAALMEKKERKDTVGHGIRNHPAGHSP